MKAPPVAGAVALFLRSLSSLIVVSNLHEVRASKRCTTPSWALPSFLQGNNKRETELAKIWQRFSTSLTISVLKQVIDISSSNDARIRLNGWAN